MLNQFGSTRALCFNNELIQIILSASRIPPGREGLKKVNLLICIEYGWLIDVLHLILVQIVDSLGTADNVDIVSILDRWKKALDAKHVLKSGVMASCHMHKKLHFLPNMGD